MRKDVIEAESIIYRLGHKNILTDVYIKCETGEIIGVLGRNGCGKSSLLKIIFGTLRTENKNIRINKIRVNHLFTKRNMISYLPQNCFLPKTLSLRKIVLKFIPVASRREVIFDDPHIAKHLNKTVNELSGGESRYFQVLLLLNLTSSFVLLDEPFSSIEPLYREKIKDLIRQYKGEKGFIVTDHDYLNIVDLCDSIKLIVNGVCKHIRHVNELERWGYVPEGTFDS